MTNDERQEYVKAWTTHDPRDSWPGEEAEEGVQITPLEERHAEFLLRLIEP